MSRSEFRACSYWQFSEMVEGWVASKEDPAKAGMSELEEDVLWDAVNLPVEGSNGD